MSLRQLAAEVGIQSGSLYNHISTKQELLFELVRDHINELLRQLDRALQGKQRPVDKLRAFTAFHVTYHMTRKREVFIANSELRSLEPKNYERSWRCAAPMSSGWRKSSAEGVAEGEFEVVDIQVATFAILALLTGLTTWYRPGGRLTKEAIVAAHEKLVLSSVAPAQHPSRAQAKRSPSPSTATRGRLERR
jgi:AcrR family transcriptional regulator